MPCIVISFSIFAFLISLFLKRKEYPPVNTILKFEDKQKTKTKSYFEMTYATVIQINAEIKDKSELEKIILCDAQTKIYPDLEKSFLDMLHNSGYPDIKFEKKIDFEKLYNQRFN